MRSTISKISSLFPALFLDALLRFFPGAFTDDAVVFLLLFLFVVDDDDEARSTFLPLEKCLIFVDENAKTLLEMHARMTTCNRNRLPSNQKTFIVIKDAFYQ